MKRVYVASLHHESNSFNPIVAGEKDFVVMRGQEILDQLSPNNALAGIITRLQDQGYEVIPGLSARAVPNGLVDKAFYLGLKQEIIDRAQDANEDKPLDAIVLALHGSMTVKDYGEAEGPLLAELRALFPEIPLVSSLDMHTSLSQEMCQYCQGFVGYKTAPHIDCTETGEQATDLAIYMLETGKPIYSAAITVPILIAGEQSATSTEPMAGLIQDLKNYEKRKSILAASYLMGYPWADQETATVSVYVVSNQSQGDADGVALDLAEKIWHQRHDFDFISPALSTTQALARAQEAVKRGKTPFYISDSGDNPTAGASSDNNLFLAEILESDLLKDLTTPLLYAGFYDPEATLACRGKVGEKVSLKLGGAFDQAGSKALELSGQVKAYLEDYQQGSFPKGDLALLSVGMVDIIIAEQHVGFTGTKMFEDLGIKLKDLQVVVPKLGYLTPEHEALAKDSVLALTKGNTNEDLASIAYKHIPRPVFPLDDGFEYKPKDNFIS